MFSRLAGRLSSFVLLLLRLLPVAPMHRPRPVAIVEMVERLHPPVQQVAVRTRTLVCSMEDKAMLEGCS